MALGGDEGPDLGLMFEISAAFNEIHEDEMVIKCEIME